MRRLKSTESLFKAVLFSGLHDDKAARPDRTNEKHRKRMEYSKVDDFGELFNRLRCGWLGCATNAGSPDEYRMRLCGDFLLVRLVASREQPLNC